MIRVFLFSLLFFAVFQIHAQPYSCGFSDAAYRFSATHFGKETVLNRLVPQLPENYQTVLQEEELQNALVRLYYKDYLQLTALHQRGTLDASNVGSYTDSLYTAYLDLCRILIADPGQRHLFLDQYGADHSHRELIQNHIQRQQKSNWDRRDNCENMDFEEGTFHRWELFRGAVDPMTTTPFSYINVIPDTGNLQHFIFNSGNDYLIPTLPKVWPEGGNYSLMLGDSTGAGGRVASLLRTFRVRPENPFFIYAYSVILQNPSHELREEPYFMMSMYDQYGNSIPEAEYAVTFTMGSALDLELVATVQGDVAYKGWTPVFVPLSNHIGQDLTIEFRTGDCTQFGHFGYAYVDALCNAAEFVISPSNCTNSGVTLSAPPGAASYLWDGPGVTGDTTQHVSVHTSGTYSVTLTPVSGAAYAMTFDTTLVIPPLAVPPIAGFSTHTPICTGTPLVLTDTSSGNGSSLISWQWNFGDTQTSTSQHTTHLYDTSGTYEVTLVVTNIAGCTDTARVWVEVMDRPDAVITPAGPFCVSEDPVALTAVEANGTWAADCGTCIDPSSGIFNPGSAGLGIHTVTYSFTGMCSNADTLSIEVLANSDASISSAGPFCTNDAPFTLQTAMPGGTWTGNGINSSTGVFDPQAAGAGNHLITYTLPGQCGDTQSISLIVNELTLQGTYTEPSCAHVQDGSIEVTASGTPPYTYVLSGNSIASNQSGIFSHLGAGIYTISVSDQNGCADTLVYSLSAPAQVVADFTASPLQGEAPLTVYFTNTSSNGSIFTWIFGNGNQSNEEAPGPEIYEAKGTYQVMLIVQQGLCSDTAYAYIQVELFSSLIVYNVFSPNGDGINDHYLVTAKNIENFECVIFNRWGQKVFTSDDPNQGWNGQDESGKEYPEGTYYYVIQASGKDGEDYHFKGFLTLIRK